MLEQFKQKSKEELANQLSHAESFFGGKIGDENVREKLLSMDLEEIKNQYPKEYQSYYNFLQTESDILHFPGIKEEAEKSINKPKINLLQAGARGVAYKINFENKPHVLKPLESTAEKNISEKASELGIGPKQYKSKEEFLNEEFINGTPLLEIEKEKCTPEFMKNLGIQFAKALLIIHENNILVNDQILSDENGKSHMIIDKDDKVRFIDFGASIDISNFPNIRDYEVMSLMRTDPLFKLFKGDINSFGEEKRKFEIAGYREHILSQYKTKEDIIMAKDFQLLGEGLSFLQQRLPNAGYFLEGIREIIHK